MKPDVCITVRFKTPEEGGRKSPVLGALYGCPMMIDGEGFDCRLMIKDAELLAGIWYDVPVKFLNRKLAIPRLSVGKKVVLWEGKDVADGVVVKMIS